MKYGHSWGDTACDVGTTSNANSTTCQSQEIWKTIPIGGVTSNCWNSENQFHAEVVKLLGSQTAPDVIFTADNNGWGFEGGGLWTMTRQMTNNQANDAIFEQCAYNRRSIGDGDTSFPLAFMAWWGGDPPDTTRYRYADIVAHPSYFHWTDTYYIDLVNTGKISVTPNPTSTPTLAPTKQPTNTPVPPTPTNSPTVTPVPSSMTLSFPSILLHGMGKAGDSVNPGSNGNLTPLHPSRTMNVALYNSSTQLITTQTGTITYQPQTGDFKGTVVLGSTVPSGTYMIKVSLSKYLTIQIPGFYQITQGQTVIIPQFSMVVGDANSDNQLNILDYNMLLGCYSDLAPATNCPGNNKALTDFSDDGNVNQTDYNLFLRELSVRTGQ